MHFYDFHKVDENSTCYFNSSHYLPYPHYSFYCVAHNSLSGFVNLRKKHTPTLHFQYRPLFCQLLLYFHLTLLPIFRMPLSNSFKSLHSIR